MTQKKPKKQRFTLSNIILWMGLFFVLIPTTVIGYILLESTFQTGTVIRGNRFNNDLNPTIDRDLLSLTEEALNSVESVQVLEINLRAATLRITLQGPEDLSADAIDALSEELVEQLSSVLPFETFFTAINNQKMYDFELIIYDQREAPSTYFTIIKNARMETYLVQNILTPKNPSLVEAIQAQREAAANPLIPGTNGEEDETDEEDTE
jgi:hypothetical protein